MTFFSRLLSSITKRLTLSVMQCFLAKSKFQCVLSLLSSVWPMTESIANCTRFNSLQLLHTAFSFSLSLSKFFFLLFLATVTFVTTLLPNFYRLFSAHFSCILEKLKSFPQHRNEKKLQLHTKLVNTFTLFALFVYVIAAKWVW